MVDLATFERLLTPTGKRVLARAETMHAEGVDALRAGEVLRRFALEEYGDAPPGAAADLAAAATTQAVLRARAAAKLGPGAERLFLTPDGLQQATRPEISVRRAARLADVLQDRRPTGGGAPTVMDLGCGIGADLLAFAAAGLDVAGVDLDPVTAAMAAANLAAAGTGGTGGTGGGAPGPSRSRTPRRSIGRRTTPCSSTRPGAPHAVAPSTSTPTPHPGRSWRRCWPVLCPRS